LENTNKQEDRKVTRLPDAEAEGAGNFGAEPDNDPTAGNTPNAISALSETAQLPEAENPQEPTPLAEEGNRTGGEPPEDIVARHADSERDEQAADQQMEERGLPEDMTIEEE